MSPNRMVTTLRSSTVGTRLDTTASLVQPFAIPCPLLYAGAVSAIRSGAATATGSPLPHWPQKRILTALRKWHTGHSIGTGRALPHWPQKRIPGGLANWHTRHSTPHYSIILRPRYSKIAYLCHITATIRRCAWPYRGRIPIPGDR